MHELPSSRGHAARVLIVLIIALAVAPLCIAALRERVLQASAPSCAAPCGTAESPAPACDAKVRSAHAECAADHAQ